jgi:OOP family OmpA-OmpF porin
MKNLILLLFITFAANFVLGQIQSTDDSALVEVIVKDFKDKIRVHDRVLFQGQKTKVLLQGMTDETGKFRLLLPEGDIYNIAIKGLGEDQEYNTFSIPKVDGRYSMATLTIKYEPAKIFTLNNLQFESGKATIKPGSEKILSELIELMQLKNTMSIEIGGYTDDVGNEEANTLLSKDRAETVKKYLFTKGKISLSRITAKGYGESQPIADNGTEEGKQMNRRTEVKITSE